MNKTLVKNIVKCSQTWLMGFMNGGEKMDTQKTTEEKMKTVKIELDDSALDEALEKSEKLIQNLEKAKTLINELASSVLDKSKVN